LCGFPFDYRPARWADTEIRAFVASCYSVGFERETPNASDLPEPAAEVLRRFDGLLRHGVQLVSTDEARTILDAVVEAGLAPPVIMNDYGIWFTLRGLSRPSVLHFNPEFPDFGPC
jgi:hypothetical protein